MPGSTLTASMASIVEPDRGEAADRWQLDLTTLDGTPCSSASTVTTGREAAAVASGAVRSSDVARATTAAADSPCQTDTSLLLAVTRFATGADARTSVPAELVVGEEPPVTNLAELPEGLPDYDGLGPVVPASTEVRPVRGATTFSAATELLERPVKDGQPVSEPRAASFADDLAAGETAFYRVHLETGQRLRATARVPGESTYALRDGERVRPVLLLHAPSRVELTRQSATATADQVATLTAATPEVRIRNRETGWTADGQPTPLGAASVPGEYYVTVQLEPGARRLSGRVVPIQLNVSVDGTPSGAPEHGAGSGQATPDAEPNQRARATSATLLVLALLIGAAANGVWLARRRDRGPR